MKKLLLTSTGLKNQNIAEQFLELLKKEPAEAKVIFINTASRTQEELFYVKESKKELLDLGILEDHIKTLNLDKKINFQEVEGFDVIYVCGGNTFYLLKKVRESSFDKVIKEFVEKGGLYLGVSAGSILVCPNIDIASPFDKNDSDLKDLTALHLTDKIVSPHYVEEEKEIIDDFRRNYQYEIVPLNDNQALLIVNNDATIIE